MGRVLKGLVGLEAAMPISSRGWVKGLVRDEKYGTREAIESLAVWGWVKGLVCERPGGPGLRYTPYEKEIEPESGGLWGCARAVCVRACVRACVCRSDIIVPLDELPPYHITKERLTHSVCMSRCARAGTAREGCH